MRVSPDCAEPLARVGLALVATGMKLAMPAGGWV
jgi:hypothetical protein